MDESQSAAFVAKLDAFAETLSLDEQALLTELVSHGDDDVAGFSAGWPGLRVIVPMFGQSGGDPKILRTEDSFAESGGDPKIFRSEGGFMESGGDPKI